MLQKYRSFVFSKGIFTKEFEEKKSKNTVDI